MNTYIMQAARVLCSAGKGKCLTKNERIALRDGLGHAMPEWYLDLLESLPLCGVGCRVGGGNIERVHSITWLEPEHILWEAREAVPGCHVLAAGYVPVAGDAAGGGDQFFVQFLDNPDPPVVQIYHDMVHSSVIPQDGMVEVARHLSDFWLSARPYA